MVEGHSVHRIAASFRRRLVGRKFAATSPNGRFTEGAKAIHNKEFARIEAVGKNLFAFFGATGGPDAVVVHVHFGMSGAWAVHAGAEPPTTPTTRLRLEGGGLVAHLSAMTVQHGGVADLYEAKRAGLGEDPLRADADPDRLWARVAASKKSIGALIMDQSYFTGPGNIYRAEMLFVAGVHPEVEGRALDRASFDRVWRAGVALLGRGYDEGSIVTVDAAADPAAARAGHRRYVYLSLIHI